MKLFRHIRAAIGGYRRNQSGVTAPIVAILFTGLVGAAGYAIDMGHVMWVQRQLQASADAAALAGALTVATDTTAATTAATAYSAASGQSNALAGATLVSAPTVTPTCFTSTSITPTCASTTTGDNGIIVTETANVPTYFLQIFGLKKFAPTATAKAAAKGGSGTSLNVMVLLDTTASMNNADSNCSGGSTRIACAQAAAQALLSGLNTATSKVGFMTFPPVSPQGVTVDTTCNNGNLSGDIVAYKNATITGSGSNYLLVGLTSGFQSTSNPAAILVGKGGSGCGQGLQAQGGVGTFYADAITAAQASLVATGSSNAQNVIILLSDGDASASSQNMVASKVNNQCSEAVTAARAAATAGTWVFTVAYGSNSNNSTIQPLPGNPTNGTTYGTPGCSTDTGSSAISPCSAMQNMASDAGKFYSDDTVTSDTKVTITGSGRNQKTTDTPVNITCTGTGGNSTDLVQLLKGISASLTNPRLVPNTTT